MCSSSHPHIFPLAIPSTGAQARVLTVIPLACLDLRMGGEERCIEAKSTYSSAARCTSSSPLHWARSSSMRSYSAAGGIFPASTSFRTMVTYLVWSWFLSGFVGPPSFRSSSYAITPRFRVRFPRVVFSSIASSNLPSSLRHLFSLSCSPSTMLNVSVQYGSKSWLAFLGPSSVGSSSHASFPSFFRGERTSVVLRKASFNVVCFSSFRFVLFVPLDVRFIVWFALVSDARVDPYVSTFVVGREDGSFFFSTVLRVLHSLVRFDDV
mmetsp:Transcript_10275/g.62969  ORF Transcript_10275/g.62969 Transcript_10275/m.62969 type:complete len:266 (+) Transcript_10275:4937-5734(+)